MFYIYIYIYIFLYIYIFTYIYIYSWMSRIHIVKMSMLSKGDFFQCN